MILPPIDKHKFYDPHYIEYALGQIKQYDFSKHNFEETSNIIRGYLESTPIVEVTIKAGNFLARARTKNDGNPYNRLSKITVRDKIHVKSFGRANKPGQAIFYCSTNHLIAAREATQWNIEDFNLIIQRGMLRDYDPHVKFATISIWKVVKDLKLAALFFNKESHKNNQSIKSFAENVLANNINQWDERVLRSKNLVLEFFSNEFARKDIQSESDYLLSSYYANEIYIASEKLDGVIYPTVAYDYEGENVALSENAYRGKLEFVTATHNYLANIEHEEQKLIMGEFSEVVERRGDILVWKDIPTGKILPIDESE